jgi:Ca-activated chloride channel homolog
MDSLQWIQQFHLIRPYWLIALLPLALVIWLYARTQIHSRSWASVIDKRLLSHLLQGSSHDKKPVPLMRLFLPLYTLGCLIILALAGPAFEKRPQPVFKNQSALVIILDLSRSMDATDIKPSRLSRARFKIDDIINTRKDGQTALIVYAANAYVVSPLTDDAKTIAAQIPALETQIMPAQGSRLDIALNKALELFNNAGHSKGNILVITDSINAKDRNTITALRDKNLTTSILAVGTAEGAPIANHNGGFVKDKNGSIVIPKLNIHDLKKAVQSGSGKFSLLSANDKDINHLLENIDPQTRGGEQADASGNKLKTDIWHEEGPWLVLFVIPFAAYAFRKGLVFALLIFILPLPQPAQAFGWSELWNNADQQATTALQNGDAKQAAELFNDPQWKATAKYKSGDYQSAAELLNSIDTAEANYNRGNALARANDLKNAIKAYERALQLDPEHDDAKYNKQLLEKAQQKENKESQQDKNNKDSQDSKDQQKGDSKDSAKQQNDQNSEQSENTDNNAAENSDKKSQEKNTEQKQNESENPSDEQPDKKKSQSSDSKQSEQPDEAKKQQTARTKDEAENQPSEEERKAMQQQLSEQTPDLEQQKTQQWLKKIPDDPGGLLRRKFKYQYGRQQNHNEQNPW